MKAATPKSGTGGGNHIKPVLNPIEQLDVDGHVVHRYTSHQIAGAAMDISAIGISDCCMRKQNKYCGFRWRSYIGPMSDCKLGFHLGLHVALFLYPYHTLLVYFSERFVLQQGSAYKAFD